MPSGAGSSVQGGGGEMVVMSRMAESEGTRARPLKAYEREPFLTIGTADIHTYGTEAITTRSRPGSGDSRHSGGQGERSTPASAGAFLYSLYASQSQSPSVRKETSKSGGCATAAVRMPSVALTSVQTPNHCVKMPFKHNIRKPSQTLWQEPAQEMKEMTALATYHMAQMLACDVVSLTKRQQGRLQKGRLKPLYPVQVTGPTIRQCRGILSETRSYSASTSRTLQRRRHIVTQLKSGALKPDMKSSCQIHTGVESVHRVSAASSVEDLTEERGMEGGLGQKEFVNEDFQAVVASMERDALFPDYMEDKESSSKAGSEDLRETETFTVAGPSSLPLQPDTSSPQNPDSSGAHLHRPSDSRTSSRKEEKVKQHAQHPRASPSHTLTGTMSTRNHISAETETSPANEKNIPSPPTTEKADLITKNSDSSQEQGPANIVTVKVKRPVSAGVKASGSPLTTLQVKARPQTATLVKTVRFADHTHLSDGKTLPVSRSNSWMGKSKGRRGEDKGRNKERKNSSGESCRPFNPDKHHKNDDDDDENEDDDKSDRKSHSREGGRGAGKGGSPASGSNKRSTQGGETRPNSQPSPQEEDVPLSHSNLQYSPQGIIGGIIEESDPVNSSRSSAHQQFTSDQENYENVTVHDEIIPSLQNHSHPEMKAENSVTAQCSADAQKCLLGQESEENMDHASNTSSLQSFGQKIQITPPALTEEVIDLQKQVFVQGKQPATGNHDSDSPVLQSCACGKDSLEFPSHLARKLTDHAARLLQLRHGVRAKRNGPCRSQVHDRETSKPALLWTGLDTHFSRWCSTCLLL